MLLKTFLQIISVCGLVEQMNKRKEHGNGSPEVATGNGKTGVLIMFGVQAKIAWPLEETHVGEIILA